MSDEKKRHFRMQAEPAQLGVEGKDLGSKAIAPRPAPGTVAPRFMVRIQLPGQPAADVPVYTPEEAMNQSVNQFERVRLLATALVAQAKQVHAAPAPAGRGEADVLRARVLELENRPRWRMWFVVTDDGCEVLEAKTREEAIVAWLKKHELPESEREEIHAVNEVTLHDVDTLLDLSERDANELIQIGALVRATALPPEEVIAKIAEVLAPKHAEEPARG